MFIIMRRYDVTSHKSVGNISSIAYDTTTHFVGLAIFEDNATDVHLSNPLNEVHIRIELKFGIMI